MVTRLQIRSAELDMDLEKDNEARIRIGRDRKRRERKVNGQEESRRGRKDDDE